MADTPTQKQCEASVRALARLHAHWWDSPSFGGDDFPIPRDKALDEITFVYSTDYREFSGYLGDRLSQSRREIYEKSLEKLPSLLKKRLKNSTQLTLAHGNAHHWNILLPKADGEVVIFDWQTWHVDVRTHDLTYLMGVWWFSEHRELQRLRV